jgi:hypothetical protein
METRVLAYIFGAAVLTVPVAALLLSAILTVEQRTTAIVQRLMNHERRGLESPHSLVAADRPPCAAPLAG